MSLEAIDALDQRITLTLNSLHFEAGDYLWQFFSLKETWYPLYAAVIFLVIKRMGWKKGLMAVLAMVLTVVACDQFANLVKNSVCRLRPCYNADMLRHGLHVLEAVQATTAFSRGTPPTPSASRRPPASALRQTETTGTERTSGSYSFGRP